MQKIVAFCLLFFIHTGGFAQKITFSVEMLTSGTPTSLRGLSVVNDNVLWVSGSKGKVGRSLNAGKNWNWITVKGFENVEFRDIEAFDANNAVIMAAGSPAYILKTNDGGESWKIVFEDRRPEMFLDAMDFANFQKGMVIGDPINGHAFVAVTDNSGNTWTELSPADHGIDLDSGEAFFAASGSNIRYFADGEYRIVSGGTKSRLHAKHKQDALDLLQGKMSTGANSIDIYDGGIPRQPGKRMVIVGGDFMADSIREGNCLYSTNGGKTWKKPVIPPNGYRSSVEFIGKKDLIACGLNGIDYSDNGGKTWHAISTEGFHVVKIARIGTSIYLAGGNGRVARLQLKANR